MPPTARTSPVSDLTGRVTLLDATTGSTVGSPVQLRGPVAGLTLAPDGRTAFVVTRADPITPGAIPTFDGWALLDLETGSVLRRGSLPETGVETSDFAPDGARVAVSFDSGRVWIVDTRTGRPVDAPAPTQPVRDPLAGVVPGRVTDPQRGRQRRRQHPGAVGRHHRHGPRHGNQCRAATPAWASSDRARRT